MLVLEGLRLRVSAWFPGELELKSVHLELCLENRRWGTFTQAFSIEDDSFGVFRLHVKMGEGQMRLGHRLT